MFWMVYVEGRSTPSKRHATEEEARAEAERLARLADNIGHKVYILEPVAVCHVPLAIEWDAVI